MGNCTESCLMDTNLSKIDNDNSTHPNLARYTQNVISINLKCITAYSMADQKTSQHTIPDEFREGVSLITYKSAVFIAGGILNPKRAWMWESNQLYSLSDLKTPH